jgi:hypothetical protein
LLFLCACCKRKENGTIVHDGIYKTFIEYADKVTTWLNTEIESWGSGGGPQDIG